MKGVLSVCVWVEGGRDIRVPKNILASERLCEH